MKARANQAASRVREHFVVDGFVVVVSLLFLLSAKQPEPVATHHEPNSKTATETNVYRCRRHDILAMNEPSNPDTYIATTPDHCILFTMPPNQTRFGGASSGRGRRSSTSPSQSSSDEGERGAGDGRRPSSSQRGGKVRCYECHRSWIAVCRS